MKARPLGSAGFLRASRSLLLCGLLPLFLLRPTDAEIPQPRHAEPVIVPDSVAEQVHGNNRILILVHATHGHTWEWNRLKPALEARGFAVFTPHLDHTGTVTDGTAPDRTEEFVGNPFLNAKLHLECTVGARGLAEQLRTYLDKTQFAGKPLSDRNLVLVGFSIGGIVERTFVKLYGSRGLGPHYTGSVDRIIQISSPNLGTPWARPVRFTAEFRDILPNSRFLTWLNFRDPSDTTDYDLSQVAQTPVFVIAGLAKPGRIKENSDRGVPERSATLDYRFPWSRVAVYDSLGNLTSLAHHGNLLRAGWITSRTLGFFPKDDTVWRTTLKHLLFWIDFRPAGSGLDTLPAVKP